MRRHLPLPRLAALLLAGGAILSLAGAAAAAERAAKADEAPRGTPPEVVQQKARAGREEAPRMRQPEHLPASARMLLLERMGNHRLDMTRLHFAVLFLEHDRAKEAAERIAAEPRLAPPLGDEGAELNSLVPARFFELQDELRQRATHLARAAAGGDDEAIARSYGKLTETCVSCHAAYLDEGP